MRSLLQFLPISKSTFDVVSTETYGTVVTSPQKLSKGQFGATPSKVFRIGLQVVFVVYLLYQDLFILEFVQVVLVAAILFAILANLRIYVILMVFIIRL